MRQSRTKNPCAFAYHAVLWILVTGLVSSASAQLNEEIGRLVQAKGVVTIVTNDGNEINAVSILALAEEGGVPIKLGNKIITNEYSSAVILSADESVHHLQEMTSIQFGTVSKPKDEASSSLSGKVVSFFMRQSGKEGDYRSEVVNTGVDDINMSVETIARDEK